MPGESSFGAWLKGRRKALDLTQRDLAERTGYALETIVKIETGERRPSKQVAERLADFLGAPAEERAAFVRFARASPADFGLGSESAGDPKSKIQIAQSLSRPSNLPAP